MPWQGNGTFRRTDGVRTGASVWQQAAAAGVDIEPDDHDVHDEDLALGLQNCLTRDGQNSPSANIPMAGFRLTGLGAATTNGHAIVYGQQNVQLGSGVQVGANFQAGAGAQLTDNLTINGQANPVSVEYFRDGTNETLANVVAAGDDDAGNKTTYVEVVYGAHDRTNGQEAGKVQVSLANGAGGKAIYSRFLPDIFQVFGYDAGSGNDPAIEIRRESASPADNDGLGWLRFYGRNDAAEDLQYASIFAKATDVSDGTEDGELGWNVTRAGSSGVRMRLGGGLVVGSGDPPSTDGVINAEGGYQLGGAALVMGEVLAEATLSNDTDFTVTWDNANDYWKIELVVSGLRPAADDTPMLRTTSDGQNFDAGASNYSWNLMLRNTGGNGGGQNNADSAINLFNAAIEGADGNSGALEITILDPGNTAVAPTINFKGYMQTSAGLQTHVTGSGRREAEAAINGIQLLFSSQNIAEGRIRVIGYRK